MFLICFSWQLHFQQSHALTKVNSIYDRVPTGKAFNLIVFMLPSPLHEI